MKMTQCERVLQYMKDWGSITTREAFNDLGCARLASRIHDLEQQGHRINRETMHTENRYGEKTHYTKYSLNEEVGGNGK